MITSEFRYRIFARDFFTCKACGAPNRGQLSIAHRIKSGSGTVKYIKRLYPGLTAKQIDNIIDHPDNLITACRGKCNDSQNVFYKPEIRDELLKSIYIKLTGGNNGH